VACVAIVDQRHCPWVDEDGATDRWFPAAD